MPQTLVERVQSVADLAGSEATEAEFLRQFGALWNDLRAAVTLLDKLARMQVAWKEGKDKAPKATWN